jgi:hypothetical protein
MLNLSNVLRLKSLGTLGRLEFDGIAFVQRPKTITLDIGVMNENVPLVLLLLNEAVAFTLVEPFDLTYYHSEIPPYATSADLSRKVHQLPN